jgi:hypothetical protein
LSQYLSDLTNKHKCEYDTKEVVLVTIIVVLVFVLWIIFLCKCCGESTRAKQKKKNKASKRVKVVKRRRARAAEDSELDNESDLDQSEHEHLTETGPTTAAPAFYYGSADHHYGSTADFSRGQAPQAQQQHQQHQQPKDKQTRQFSSMVYGTPITVVVEDGAYADAMARQAQTGQAQAQGRHEFVGDLRLDYVGSAGGGKAEKEYGEVMLV